MRMDWCISFLWLVNYLRWTQCVHFSQLCYLGPVSSPLLGSFSSLEDEAVGLPVICMGPFISFPRQTAHTGRTTTITTNSNSTAPEEMPQGSDVARSIRVERLWRGSAEEFEDVYSYPLFLRTEDQYSKDARSKWHSGAKERNHLPLVWTSLVAQTVKRLSTMRETWVRSLGWEDPLEKEMAVHSSTLASKIPWTEEPCRLQSMGSQSPTWLSNFTRNKERLYVSGKQMRIIWSSCLFDFWQGILSCFEETGSWALLIGQHIWLEVGAAAFIRGAAVTVRAAETLVVTGQSYVAISWSLEFLCRKGSRLCKGRGVCV